MMAETFNATMCAIRGAFAWWLGELQGMVPDRLHQMRCRKRSRVILSYCDGELRRQGADREEGALRSMPANPRRHPQATLRLGPDQGLCTTLDLPLAAEDYLEQLLYFEMDRLTPFQANQVYFAYRITGTNQERQRLSIAVHLAPRQLIDAAREAARRLKIEVNRVELAGADDGSDPALNLLPADPPKRGPSSRLNLALGLIAVVLAVAALVIPLQHQNSTATALERQVAAAKVKAEKALALHERLQMIAARQNLVIERKIEAPMVTRLIAELTRLIPDQAHVTQLHIREDAIQVHGYAEAAAGLIGALARSNLLHEPHFRSPVTRDLHSGLERFHISMRLGEGGE